MGNTFVIDCRPEGMRFIYDDDLAVFMDHGKSEIRRASYVEPESPGRWFADLDPVHGPKLGPFKTRGEALKAEVEWLERNLLGV